MPEGPGAADAGGAGASGTQGGSGGAAIGDAGVQAGGGSGGDGIPPVGSGDCNPVEQVIEKIDLLFVVDNSGSMQQEQASLREEFPKVVQVLTTGDTDGDGDAEFPPVTDLHLGVVSSDMGLIGISGIDKCAGLGDDGILLHTPSPEISGCQPSYPAFLTYAAEEDDPAQTATDFACIASLGTDGCGFEQQLEAGLKALWPSIDFDPQTGTFHMPPRVVFLPDANGFGALGHGDHENQGFLRNDPEDGVSLIAVIVVTDEEDCSSANTSHFTPPEFLGADDPRASQPLNLRCFYNPANLYPIERYVRGLRALRPTNEALVMFAAIAGVPPDLVSPAARAAVDFSDAQSRDQYYQDVLDDPDMQEIVDPASTMTPGSGNLTPSCDTDTGRAYPPRRIVEVARRFGENGLVQSICDADFGPAMDAILGRIGDRLRNPCGAEVD